MGIQKLLTSETVNKMKTFVAFLTIVAVALADVTSHATVKHGHGHDGYSHAVEHAPTHRYSYRPVQTYRPAPTYKPTVTYKPAPTYKPTTTTPKPTTTTPEVKYTTTKPVYKPTPAYQAPTYHRPTYHQPAYKEPTYDAHANYNFEWEVVDDYAKLNYGQSEGRDGYATTGEYRVLLPDCRTQVVKYNTADGYSGNVVEASYEGTPCYEAYKPAPTYHAVPAYKAAPSYHA